MKSAAVNPKCAKTKDPLTPYPLSPVRGGKGERVVGASPPPPYYADKLLE